MTNLLVVPMKDPDGLSIGLGGSIYTFAVTIGLIAIEVWTGRQLAPYLS